MGAGARRLGIRAAHLNVAMSLVCRDLAVTPPGGAHPVVENVTLTVAPGEWLAIAGDNGGGKTSLALALAGLWPASAGEVTLAGEAIHPASPARVHIACVLQDPGSQLLQPTVADEIAFALHNLGHDPAAIDRAVREAAATFTLTDELARDPRTLSAGGQQRVLIAAAAALEPALLVADEPTAHLDPEARAQVVEWLRGARARGLAAVWVTQDPDELQAADRVFRLGAESAASEVCGCAPPAGAPVVSIAVALPAGTTGPRVRCRTPLAFTIGERGITALVGPNGSGKSVLLAALGGLVESAQIARSWRRTPDAPPILTLQYPELQVFEEKVADEVLYAARVRGREPADALAAAQDAFVRLGFEPETLLGRRTWELSTGEKRLVETVGALIAPAGLILLDEPTAGLDARRRHGLAALILARAATTPVVIASQDRGWLESLGAERVEVAGPAADR